MGNRFCCLDCCEIDVPFWCLEPQFCNKSDNIDWESFLPHFAVLGVNSHSPVNLTWLDGTSWNITIINRRYHVQTVLFSSQSCLFSGGVVHSGNVTNAAIVCTWWLALKITKGRTGNACFDVSTKLKEYAQIHMITPTSSCQFGLSSNIQSGHLLSLILSLVDKNMFLWSCMWRFHMMQHHRALRLIFLIINAYWVRSTASLDVEA